MLAVVALSYEEEAEITLEERKKDLIDHRDDSTFSFDPATLNVQQLSKQRKKIDNRKGLLMASYSRKKTRRRKKGKDGGSSKSNSTGSGGDKDNNDNKSLSLTPTPSPSPRTVRPQALQLQRTRGLLQQAQLNQLQQQALHTTIDETNTKSGQPNVHTLHPLGVNYKGQLCPSSRQASSNASEGGVNRESSLDDSGVDVEESELVHLSNIEVQRDIQITPVTLALSKEEVRIIKCNGNLARLKQAQNVYALHPEDYLSQIVVLGE